ncbi:MAG: (Fe-S)-binding protein, partial [Chloroflexi bacterium]|nr:(Fe-S)-binding protein [Chloroflexota bacterium]
YNGVYDPPRQVLRGVPGLELVRMPREREDAFCCGGGSGNFAMDLLEGSRDSPNRVRVREAYESGAGVLAVACPSCLTMLTSAVESEGLDDKLVVRDIGQILRQALVT